MPTDIWIISTNGEKWTSYEEFTTREEAIEHAPAELDLDVGQTFYTARKAEQKIDNLVSPRLAECFAEQIYEAICADLNDGVGEGWFSLNKIESIIFAGLLSKTVEEFIMKNPPHMPNWFMPEDVKEHLVTANPS